MTWLTAFLASSITVLTIVMAGSWCSTIVQSGPNNAGSETLPDGLGKEIVIRKCLPCHNVRVTTARRGSGSADEWEQVVNKMVSQGAELSDDEIDVVVQYLSTNYGPSSRSTHLPSSGTEADPASDKKARPTTSVAPATPVLSNPSGTVLVNKAGVGELESALGLSRTEAEAIARYRERHGNFKSWQEVSSVPGVPPEKIKENQKRLVF
jgi:competence ComEA-like helix-hairpin-helix protein